MCLCQQNTIQMTLQRTFKFPIHFPEVIYTASVFSTVSLSRKGFPEVVLPEMQNIGSRLSWYLGLQPGSRVNSRPCFRQKYLKGRGKEQRDLQVSQGECVTETLSPDIYALLQKQNPCLKWKHTAKNKELIWQLLLLHAPVRYGHMTTTNSARACRQ